ncbi:MAG: HTTM domain-containing protein [Maioricimonas sp. JB049]
MSRLIAWILHYPVRLVRTSADCWQQFWFTPVSPTLLGMLRICCGLMLVYTHAVWGTALDEFFGPHAWVTRDLALAYHGDDYAFSFWWWVPPESAATAHAACMALLVLFTVGFATRLTSIAAFLVTVSYIYRVPGALFGLDKINAMLALYLAIGPSGAALSVDRWIRTRLARRKRSSSHDVRFWSPPPSASANFALRLIQVHMCVIYFFAGLTKLQGPAWWDGQALWMAFANLEYQTLDMTWIAWYPRLANLLTHISIAWELSFCVLIWKPLLRPLVLFGAVALHIGIGVCLGMWTFGLIMLIGCMSFLPPESLARLVAGDNSTASADQQQARSLSAKPAGVAAGVPSEAVSH